MSFALPFEKSFNGLPANLHAKFSLIIKEVCFWGWSWLV